MIDCGKGEEDLTVLRGRICCKCLNLLLVLIVWLFGVGGVGGVDEKSDFGVNSFSIPPNLTMVILK